VPFASGFIINVASVQTLTTRDKFPGYPLNRSSQVRSFIIHISYTDRMKDLHEVLEEEPRLHCTQQASISHLSKSPAVPGLDEGESVLRFLAVLRSAQPNRRV
jgi:hypothetical protein